VVVSSPGELNFISMNILVNPGDHVICVAPAYQSLYEIVRSLGGELSFWKPNPENWEFEVEALAPLIQDNTKLIVLNFPHNPTGAYLTRTQLEAIVALSRKHDITIFSDEMYNKLLPGGTPPLPPVCDLYEKGISLWGTSKSFGLAGLRTGWLVCQNRSFLDKVVAFKDYLSICTSAPSEVLSLIALNHIEAFLEPNLQKIERNIAYFKEFMGTTDIIPSFIPPKAGSTAFVPLNIESTALEFSNQLVKETSIMTLPAEMFEYEGKYIRVGFGRENFPEALQLFADYLEALSNHST
jgi:aspartate/methionine/tyrosine aminotransferase